MPETPKQQSTADNGAGGPGRPPEPRPVHVTVSDGLSLVGLAYAGVEHEAGPDRLPLLLAVTGRGSGTHVTVDLALLPELVASLARTGPDGFQAVVADAFARAYGRAALPEALAPFASDAPERN